MLEYVALPVVASLIAGVILLFLEYRSGFFARRGESHRKPIGGDRAVRRTRNRWAITLAVSLLLVMVLGVLIGLIVPQLIPSAQSVPLKVQLLYDFEYRKTILQTEPWDIFASEEGHVLTLSKDRRYAHSGSRSLRLDAELKPREYVGIKAYSLTQNSSGAATAWVHIPASEQAGTRNFRATLTVYGYDSAGDLIGFRSESLQVQPGVWTLLSVSMPVKLTGELATESGDRAWSGRITEMYLSVSCDKQYSGPVFIDDVTIYEESGQAMLAWKDLLGWMALVIAVVFELTLLIRRMLRLWQVAPGTEELGGQSRVANVSQEVFLEDFANGFADWMTDGDWNIMEHNGERVVKVTNSGVGGIAKRCLSWTDYVFEFDTRIEKKFSGWLIRAKDLGNYVLLQCRLDRIQVCFKANGQYYDLTWTRRNAISLPQCLELNVWYHIQIEVRGTQASVTIQGPGIVGRRMRITEIPPLRHPGRIVNYSEGSVGFREAQDECALFRNVQVTRLR